MELARHILATVLGTLIDVLPIAAVLLIFQLGVLRQPLPHARRILVGAAYVVLGMTLFLVGLEEALFPLGRRMAEQLIALANTMSDGSHIAWWDYHWVYAFAFAIGFATTVAEPALIAVTLKAHEVSGGAIPLLRLRLAVAVGVGFGVAVGCLRIVTGTPLPYFIIAGYAVVLLQTTLAPKMIVPLAYDSGGVTTSTVTVPVVTALGLGLAGAIPGRSPLIDGFGLIAFASLFPIMSVLAYSWLAARRNRRATRPVEKEGP